MAEYIAMITMSALMVTLYWGGWHLPWRLDGMARGLGVNVYGVISIAVFLAKTSFFLFLFLWTQEPSSSRAARIAAA